MKQKLKKNNNCKLKGPNIVGVFLLSLFFLIFVSLASALLVSIMKEKIPVATNPSVSVVSGEVNKFKSYSEIKEFLDESSVDIVKAGSFGGSSMRMQTMDSLNDSKEAGSWKESSPVEEISGETDYSTTNVQVAGVDEGDIIKTDGKYVYAISGNEVIITDAYPAEDAEIISRIKLDSTPSGIYINKNKLAVYGQNYNIYKYKEISDESNSLLKKRINNNYTYLKTFDISDKEDPKEEQSLDFEGNFVNSRLIGDYLYFITANYVHYYDDEIPVPLVLENGEVINKNNIECQDCWNIYYFDIPYRSHNFTSVASINISDSEEKIKNETYLLDGNQNNMFVSENNIYITYHQYISEEELMWDIVKEMILPKLDARDRERVKEIEETKNYILTPEERLEKVGFIIQNFAESLTEEEQENLKKEMEVKAKQKYEDISKELEKTIVHKIAIDEGDLNYKTAGEVPGVVLNQFSMDEDKGYFRIATTKNRNWTRFNGSSESYNNIYVLNENMKVIGKVEKLAEGEKIYSVRFMQDRAYLVTFKQIDPLFVIDLSSPTNPKVLGELKIPGFSNYLHPYDETTLIGLGKDSGSWNASLKLSLFDISDVKNPREIDSYILSGERSDSIALRDHKAFLFSKKKNLLVIPVNVDKAEILVDKVFKENNEEGEMNIIREMPKPDSIKYFNGAMVFYLDKNGFKLKGKVDHSDDNNNYRYGSDTVKRSLYIENILYTLSNKYLKMNDLSDIEEVNSLEFEKDHADLAPPAPLPIQPIF